MKNLNFMLDLETMGTRPDAAIVAIGVVAFNTEGTGRTFYCPVSLESSMAFGGTVDADTITWWMKQSDAARQVFTTGSKKNLPEALGMLADWMLNVAGSTPALKEAAVWGNGADFDNVILASAYRNCKLPQPWGTFKNRCYRTLRQQWAGGKLDLPRPGGVAHHAEHDALYQANNLIHLADMQKQILISAIACSPLLRGLEDIAEADQLEATTAGTQQTTKLYGRFGTMAKAAIAVAEKESTAQGSAA